MSNRTSNKRTLTEKCVISVYFGMASIHYKHLISVTSVMVFTWGIAIWHAPGIGIAFSPPVILLTISQAARGARQQREVSPRSTVQLGRARRPVTPLSSLVLGQPMSHESDSLEVGQI